MDFQSKSASYQLPKRPRSTQSISKFHRAQITSNLYHVKTKQIDEIHIYKIKFIPAIPYDDRMVRKKLLQQFHPQIIKNIHQCIYSGFNIFSLQSNVIKQFKLKSNTHQLQIKQVKILNIKNNPYLLVHFLNNGLKNLMQKLNYMEVGQTGKFFNIQQKKNIQNLLVFSGFQANFMQLQKGIYLRVDTARKIVRNQTVLQFIDQFYRDNPSKQKQQKRQMLKKQLVDQVIMTNYGRPRYVKIVDISFADLNQTYIPQINVPILNYYQQKYNIKIQKLKQPLLEVEQRKKNQKKTYMIPELCLMTGIPNDFDEFRRKKITQATLKSVQDRKTEINGFINEIKNSDEIQTLKQMGINLNRQMQNINAKIIPPPKLKLGNDQRVQPGKQSFFNLFNQPIFSNKHNLVLGLISFKSAPLAELIDVFQKTSKKLGILFQMTKITLGEFDTRKSLKQIQNAVYTASQKKNCNICLIVIPNNMKSKYKKLKQICLLQNNLVCQIVTEGTLKKNGLRSIATKILIQLIAKRGNTLWVPQCGQKLQNTMLIALDHSRCGNKNIVCGVGSINSTFTSMATKIEQYTDINDKMNKCHIIILKLIDKYVKRNKNPPKQIIIFNDTYPNDQINLYYQLIIKPVISKLQQLYHVNKSSWTFICVNTKTKQRFFKNQNGIVKNVPAGTIVSENIVSNYYDFFMVSQYTNRGSTIPNHYKVIYTDSKMQQDLLQQLIYNQCFNYVNWTGSIKIPGILQYARKCTKFNQQVLENRKISEQLQNKLYFI